MKSLAQASSERRIYDLRRLWFLALLRGESDPRRFPATLHHVYYLRREQPDGVSHLDLLAFSNGPIYRISSIND